MLNRGARIRGGKYAKDQNVPGLKQPERKGLPSPKEPPTPLPESAATGGAIESKTGSGKYQKLQGTSVEDLTTIRDHKKIGDAVSELFGSEREFQLIDEGLLPVNKRYTLAERFAADLHSAAAEIDTVGTKDILDRIKKALTEKDFDSVPKEHELVQAEALLAAKNAPKSKRGTGSRTGPTAGTGSRKPEPIIQRSARDTALDKLTALRDRKPRPLKFFGKNPTEEQIQEHKWLMRAWNRDYRKAQLDFKKLDAAPDLAPTAPKPSRVAEAKAKREESQPERKGLPSPKEPPTPLPESAATGGGSGSTDKVFLPDGSPIEFRYGLRESSDLVTSHNHQGRTNPDYPKDLQPRDRERSASKLQIQKMTKSLNPELLGKSALASDGAPIIGPDNVVESGNARSIAIGQAYRAKLAEEYRQWLSKNAEQFGLTPEQVENMKNPVLVRERLTDVNRAEFARQANQSNIATMGPAERALMDAERITADHMDMLNVPEDGNMLAGNNRKFVRQFIAMLGPEEAAQYLTKEGLPTKQLSDRIQAAIFAKAYGDERLLAIMAEEADPDIKNILNALSAAAPEFAKTKTLGIDDAINIVPYIVEAVELVQKAKLKGVPLETYLKQPAMFSKNSEGGARLAQYFAANMRSAKRIAEELVEIGRITNAELSRNQNTEMFPRKKVTADDIIQASLKKMEGIHGEPKGQQQTINVGRTVKGRNRGGKQAERGRATTEDAGGKRTSESEVATSDESDKPVLFRGGGPSTAEIVDALKSLPATSREAYAKLSSLGQRIYNDGADNFRTWRDRFKSALGDLWDRFKQHVRKIWDQRSKWVGNERGAVGKSNRPNAPLEMPELVHLATELMEGNYPIVARALRTKYALGTFRAGDIRVKASVYANEAEALKVLSHEIGHLVDWLPTKDLKRGNILGRVATLSNYLATTLDAIPTDPSQYLSKNDRRLIRKAAIQEARSQGADSKEELAAMVQAIYHDKIEEEIANRGLLTRDEIMNELKRLTQERFPFDEGADQNYTKYRYSSKELYAEAVSAIIVDPSMAQDAAPKFWDAWMAYLERKPEVMRLYDDIQDEIRGGNLNERAASRLREGFRKGEIAWRDSLTEDNRYGEQLKTQLIDLHHGIIGRVKRSRAGEKAIAPEENPRYAIEAMTYGGAEAEHHILGIHQNVIKTLRDQNLSWEDFGEYLYHNRVVNERSEIANPEGFTAQRSAERLAEMERRLTLDQGKALLKAQKEFHKWHQEVVSKVEEANMYGPDLMKTMKDAENYATFNVVKYMADKFGGGPGASIFKQYGTHQQIANPATATIMKDLAMIRSVNRNQAARSVVDFMKSEYPQEIKIADKKWNGKAMIPQEPSDPNTGMIRFMNEGQMEGWYVPQSVADSFERNPVEGMLIAKILKGMAQPFKMVFTELNYGFWLYNIRRDYKRAVRNLPGATATNFAKHWMQALRPAFKSAFGIPDSVVDEMLKGKMLISIADSRGLKDMEKQEERLLAMYGIDEQAANAITKTWRAFQAVGRALERTTKVAGYTFLKKRYPQMSEGELRHRVIGQVGSPDFLRKGAASPIYNNVLLFSGAAKEGWRSDYESMKDKPGEWWWKVAKYTILPKLLMIAAYFGLAGDKNKRIMNAASEYDLTNYNVIPLGETDHGKAVYLKLPQDETGRLMGGIMWKLAAQKKKEWTTGLFDYMAGQAPTLNPALSTIIAVTEYASGKNPYDWFRSKPALNELVNEAGGMRAHKEMAKWLANQSGAGLIYRFRSGDEGKIKTELEKILDMPFVSNSLGRFLKVSDAGISQGIKADMDVFTKKRANEILDARDAIANVIDGTKLTDEQTIAMLKHPDTVENYAMKMIARRYGNIYYEKWLQANTIEEKIIVLKHLIKNNPKLFKKIESSATEEKTGTNN
jgi:hypothetical protein